MTDDPERTKRPAKFAVDDDVPRLPRGRGLRLSGPQLARIAGTVLLLVFLVMAQRPCANAVSTFVTGFGSAGDRGSAASAMPRPGTVDVPGPEPGGAPRGDMNAGSGSATGSDALGLDQYEHLRPGMTDAEVKAVIERARSKAAGRSAAP